MDPTDSSREVRQHLIALYPRHGIYLASFGYTDDARLAQVFRQSWRQIPLWGRRPILAYWGLRRELPAARRPLPQIAALPDWGGRDCIGECSGGGAEIRFLSFAVDALPDELLAALIGHELAHAYDWARGRVRRNMPEEMREESARVLTGAWGFDEDGLDKWLLDGGADRIDAAERRWRRRGRRGLRVRVKELACPSRPPPPPAPSPAASAAPSARGMLHAAQSGALLHMEGVIARPQAPHECCSASPT